MDDYINLVRKLSAQDSKEIISNGSTDHAAVLMSEMFRRQKGGKAYIFTGSLNPLLYCREEVLRSIKEFLESGGKIDIIVQNEPEKTSDASLNGSSDDGLFAKIKSSGFHDRLSIRRAPSSLECIPYHFAVIGDKSFRFEPEKNKHEAFASFNRKEMAQTLVGKFAEFWGRSSVVSPLA